MSTPLDELYFEWLITDVFEFESSSTPYFDLIWRLYCTEFFWLVPGDENRVMDGVALRSQFATEMGVEPDESWLSMGCSVLELLVAFAGRAAYQTGDTTKRWFWIFLMNLGLTKFRTFANGDSEAVDRVLHDFIWRSYSPKGHGGLFPLSRSPNDQRGVDIFYQFSEYVGDQGIV